MIIFRCFYRTDHGAVKVGLNALVNDMIIIEMNANSFSSPQGSSELGVSIQFKWVHVPENEIKWENQSKWNEEWN